MIIDDTSKDKILDDLMERIVVCQNKYHNDWHWLGKKGRNELRERIGKLTMNYNMIIEKRYNKSNHKMLRPLHVPGPQPEEEVRELMRLIDE